MFYVVLVVLSNMLVKVFKVLRMNIHRKGKSGCEIAIDHFKNVCPDATFTILILERLPGDGYVNEKIDQKMLEY